MSSSTTTTTNDNEHQLVVRYCTPETCADERCANYARSKVQTIVSVDGHVTGALWWPIGHPAAKQINAGRAVLAEDRARESVYVNSFGDKLAGLVAKILSCEEGDFSSAARLTADSVVTVTRVSHHGRSTTTRARAYDATELRALMRAELVAPDAFSSDFYPEED